MLKPFNLQKWIDEHAESLKPPVGNKQVYTDIEDFIVMVVGGPNGRKDYHYEDGEELFYQLKGDIIVKIINQSGKKEDIFIKEGEMFLLPPHVPHSPQRPENTIGLVIERKRKKGEMDRLMWFCQKCDHLIFDSFFALKNIGVQIKEAIIAFESDPKHSICTKCGNNN